MEQEVLDLRTRRTYKFLGDALYQLMLEKPFEQITVTDICKKAMVHRTTFYKHFEDKYQLLRMMFLDEVHRFEVTSLKESETEREFYKKVIRQMFEYAALYKDFFVQGIEYKENNFMTGLLNTTITSYLKRCFQLEERKSGRLSKIPINIMSEYYAGAAIALAMWWLENNMSVPIEQMVEYMDALIVW